MIISSDPQYAAVFFQRIAYTLKAEAVILNIGLRGERQIVELLRRLVEIVLRVDHIHFALLPDGQRDHTLVGVWHRFQILNCVLDQIAEDRIEIDLPKGSKAVSVRHRSHSDSVLSAQNTLFGQNNIHRFVSGTKTVIVIVQCAAYLFACRRVLCEQRHPLFRSWYR